MYVTEPCPICQKNERCDCQSSMATFFAIVKKASERVLRVEPSSIGEHSQVISAGIDKINAYFSEPVSIDCIRAAIAGQDHPAKRVFLKDRKPYLAIGSDSKQIHLKLGYGEKDVTALISNPNRFNNWKNYCGFLSSIIPQNTLAGARVTRLDLNLDFKCSFPSLIQKLDIKNKRSAVTFMDSSGCRTGLIIGKGDEKIEIYDKAKKEKLENPHSRIELRLGKEKLPSRSIFEIPKALTEGLYFDGLVGVTTHFTDAPTNQEQSQRLSTFKNYLERDGFYSAKKAMNQSRNFERDFAKLVKIQPWAIQLSQLFKTNLKMFTDSQECQ